MTRFVVFAVSFLGMIGCVLTFWFTAELAYLIIAGACSIIVLLSEDL